MALTVCQVCGFAGDGLPVCPVCQSQVGSGAEGVAWVDTPTHPTPRLPRGGGELTVVHAPGRVFAGRYRIEGPVGRGAMGVVLRVEDQQRRRTVALKLIGGDAADPEVAGRFRREVKIASELKHPNAVAIYDAGVAEGVSYYTMELVDGGSVADLVKGRRPLPLDRVEAIAAQLCSVLTQAHAMGVVHRDIKPSNVLLTSGGTVKLVDFGIAKLHGSDVSALTRTGMMAGTVQYMAPEQLRDSKHVDARADLYATGVLLFEMLTGHPPFSGATPMEVALKHLNEPPPAVAPSRPDVPASLERVVARCLEKEPRLRFQSARELAEALTVASDAATREKMGNGDVVVVYPPGARFALEIFVRDGRPDWAPGQRLELDGRLYRLEQRVEARPPFQHGLRFSVQTDLEAIGRPIDYRAWAQGPPAGGLLNRLARRLRGEE